MSRNRLSKNGALIAKSKALIELGDHFAKQINWRRCDEASEHFPCVGEFRRLPTSKPDEFGSTSAVILCRKHFDKEMKFRKGRNRDLEEFAQFDIPRWESLEVVEEDPNQTKSAQATLKKSIVWGKTTGQERARRGKIVVAVGEARGGIGSVRADPYARPEEDGEKPYQSNLVQIESQGNQFFLVSFTPSGDVIGGRSLKQNSLIGAKREAESILEERGMATDSHAAVGLSARPDLQKEYPRDKFYVVTLSGKKSVVRGDAMQAYERRGEGFAEGPFSSKAAAEAYAKLPTTGLINQRGFEREAEAEARTARRTRLTARQTESFQDRYDNGLESMSKPDFRKAGGESKGKFWIAVHYASKKISVPMPGERAAMALKNALESSSDVTTFAVDLYGHSISNPFPYPVTALAPGSLTDKVKQIHSALTKKWSRPAFSKIMTDRDVKFKMNEYLNSHAAEIEALPKSVGAKKLSEGFARAYPAEDWNAEDMAWLKRLARGILRGEA